MDDTEPSDAAEIDAADLLAVIAEVAGELHPDLGDREVHLDTSLDRELGFDSLGRVELFMRLEQRFAVGLPDSVLASADTPRDLLRAVAAADAMPDAPAADAAAAPLGRVEAAPERARTLIEMLEWHVEKHPDRRHITFLGEGEPEEISYAGLYRRAAAVAGGLQEAGLEAGQAVALMLPSGLDYFAAFYGVLLAGGVPVPLYPPVRPSQIEDHLRRQAGILSTALVRHLVTFDRVLSLARLLRGQVETLDRVLTVAELESAGRAPRLPAVQELDTAFLQFTSGSTSDPKGVILTHANLLANLRAIGRGVSLGPEDVCVSWLPLYHDMGLIGAWMGTLFYAVPLVLMSPLRFLARPARWLRAVSRYGGTISAAPNFAYELCLTKVADDELEGVDLSSWRASLNGAEPVSPDTIRRFTERFEPYGYRPETMMPVYGLAECSLAVAFPPENRRPVIDVVRRDELTRSARAIPAAGGEESTLSFVGCGYALHGHELRIVDDAGRELGDRQEGRVEFRGPSATSGYYRNPEATRKLFDGDWLDSGDKGYLANGELFVTGRAKDMIIRAGRNIYPQELEAAVGDLPDVRKGCVAVFGSPDPRTGTERLVVLAETRRRDEAGRGAVRQAIQDVAVDVVGAPADDVVLVAPQTVPKTSSGKIRRAAGRELYEQGRLGGRRQVWWQVTRLAFAGARARAGRSARAAGALLHAGRFWAVVGLAALPIGATVALLPRLTRRRRAARQAARQLARLTATELRVEGLEHLETAGAHIVAANHASYLDAFALTASLPPGRAFLAKKELTESFLAKLLLSRLGTLFVERFDPNRGVEDIQRAVAATRRGESLLFFPEGTFDRSPGLRPFRLGAFFVAAQAGVPVVPVAIRGTRSMLRGDDWFPRRGSVAVIVRPPIAPDGSDLEAAARLRDACRAEILRYCGEPDLGGEDLMRQLRAERAAEDS